MQTSVDINVQQAAKLVAEADGLLITAGAGMGVDSGLPDFRSEGGFWKHYPALAKARLGFTSIACPEAFRSKPELAWGFYGHRLRLYRGTVPHEGFHILKRWSDSKPNRNFVFTSNVDGQFQNAGFDLKQIVEVHGSIHQLQCLNTCNGQIWPADSFEPLIDEEHCRLLNDPPRCPDCGGIARPNILMFGDWEWLDVRSKIQSVVLKHWLERTKKPVVIELGAGTDIPTVRLFGENQGARIIRINVRESEVRRDGDVGLPMSALDALMAIDKSLTTTQIVST
jgi:NAD-dependent SIR2 family protein deacetylase